MKVLKMIKKIIFIILGVIFFAFAIIMTIFLLNRNKYGVTQLNEMSYILVKENMFEKYNKGDLVLVQDKRLDKIKEEDEIFVYKVDSRGVTTIEVGIIGEVHLEEEAVTFENGSTYAMKFIIGESYKVYPKIGNYLSFISSTWGFLFLILVPSFLIFIQQLFGLIVEIKYGKE